MFAGLRKLAEVIVQVVTHLAYGCPIRAIVQPFGPDKRAVVSWRDRAGRHCQRVYFAALLRLRKGPVVPPPITASVGGWGFGTQNMRNFAQNEPGLGLRRQYLTGAAPSASCSLIRSPHLLCLTSVLRLALAVPVFVRTTKITLAGQEVRSQSKEK